MIRNPEPLAPIPLLGTVSDERLVVALEAVIVRDSPGSWAKNVDWDEYLIRIRNRGSEPVQIYGVTVVDSLGTPIAPGLNRRQLVAGTRAAKRRYKDEGLKVQAGVNGAVLMGAGVAAAAGTSGVGTAAMAGGSAAVVASAAVALAVGGVVRGLNNNKVSGEIKRRQTPLPIALVPSEEISAHIFFPVSPSPRKVEVQYLCGERTNTLALDTKIALHGLHLEIELE